MRVRLIRIVTLLCVLAGAFAGVARALDFDDEDPQPVQTEVGRVLDYKIGTHAGCLPHHLVILSGALAPGTTLTQVDDHTGLISGIPTAAGKYTVWLAVKDCENKSAESLFEFDVGERTYAIQTTSLPNGALGASYSAKLQAGNHPIQSQKFELAQGALPAGLTLAADGTISGTPTAPGATTFTVRATSVGDDGAIRIDSRQFTLTVTGSYTISASRRLGEVGVPFSSTLAARGGAPPLQWSAPAGLPAGLSVDTQGVISGVPLRAGTYDVNVHFVDAKGAASDAHVALAVRPRLVIATRALPAAAARRAYRASLGVRGGAGGLRWSIARGALPRGMRLATRTGAITGASTRAGTFRFTVRVRDALGGVSTRALALRVR
jgi:large repetitive protein